MFPQDLYDVRHAQAEGNLAGEKAKQGDHSCYDIPGFSKRSGHNWRLTDFGINQSEFVGQWLKENLGEQSNPRFYLSPFIRPKETFLESGWTAPCDIYEESKIRERSWGDLDNLSPQERTSKFREIMVKKSNGDPLYWAPPNGESLLEVCERRSLFHGTLHRFQEKYPTRPVVCFTHGEYMWAGRYLIMRSTVEEFDALDRSKNPLDRCHNCQIWHYSRKDPHTGIVSEDFCWFRSICPWDQSLSTNVWQPIERHPLTIDDLRRQVDAVPRLVI
jgi:broad specificity phosphatase PhoE